MEEYLCVSGSFNGTVASVGLISGQIYFHISLSVHLESPYSASMLHPGSNVPILLCLVTVAFSSKVHFIVQNSQEVVVQLPKCIHI